jgi:hypothetical protein
MSSTTYSLTIFEIMQSQSNMVRWARSVSTAWTTRLLSCLSSLFVLSISRSMKDYITNQKNVQAIRKVATIVPRWYSSQYTSQSLWSRSGIPLEPQVRFSLVIASFASYRLTPCLKQGLKKWPSFFLGTYKLHPSWNRQARTIANDFTLQFTAAQSDWRHHIPIDRFSFVCSDAYCIRYVAPYADLNLNKHTYFHRTWNIAPRFTLPRLLFH